MALQKLINLLPEVYKNLLPKFFENMIPKEKAATCSDCAMCVETGEEISLGIQFSKETKCCTHYPNLSNYIVGALLSSNDPRLKKGQERVHEVIYSKLGIVPLGIRSTRKYNLLNKQAPNAFGKSRTMLCPFFRKDEGLCSIYPFWNATCNTWFCKYNAGHDGQKFWIALLRYLGHVEKVLTQYVAYKMGFEARHIILPKTDMEPWTESDFDDQPPDLKIYEKQWGKWAGREEEFYKETYGLILDLSRDDFDRIAGITQEILLKNLEDKHRDLIHPILPKILRRNPKLVVEKTKQGTYILTSYSPFDPFEVSKRIYDMLDFFDGYRSNKDSCGLILDQLGAEPTEDLLLTLCQFRILTAKE
jgi:Fe-S-cluster containining protein